MGALNLQRFCSTDETRQVICQPWVWQGHEYATDGRIIVRVPTLAADDFERVTGMAPYKGALEIFEESAPLARLALPHELPTQEAVTVLCMDCEFYKKMRLDHPCSDNDFEAFQRNCEECDGFGFNYEWPIIKLGGHPYSAGALVLLSQLPGCSVFQGRRPPDKKEGGRLYFQFEGGGEGVVLALRDDATKGGLIWPWPSTFGVPTNKEKSDGTQPVPTSGPVEGRANG